MQAPKDWSSEINSIDKLRDVYYDISNKVSVEFYDRVARGEISRIEAENLSEEATVKELCKRYGIPFCYDSWNTIWRTLP